MAVAVDRCCATTAMPRAATSPMARMSRGDVRRVMGVPREKSPDGSTVSFDYGGQAAGWRAACFRGRCSFRRGAYEGIATGRPDPRRRCRRLRRQPDRPDRSCRYHVETRNGCACRQCDRSRCRTLNSSRYASRPTALCRCGPTVIRCTGRYVLDGSSMSIGNLACTLIACPMPGFDQLFTSALQNARTASVADQQPGA